MSLTEAPEITLTMHAPSATWVIRRYALADKRRANTTPMVVARQSTLRGDFRSCASWARPPPDPESGLRPDAESGLRPDAESGRIVLNRTGLSNVLCPSGPSLVGSMPMTLPLGASRSSAALNPTSQLPAQLGLKARSYLALTKPRIIELLLVTTLPTMFVARRGVPSVTLMALTMIGGALAAGGANALNMVLDRDIDRLMKRTAEPSSRHRRADPGQQPPSSRSCSRSGRSSSSG